MIEARAERTILPAEHNIRRIGDVVRCRCDVVTDIATSSASPDDRHRQMIDIAR
jgi:hypothetical protein